MPLVEGTFAEGVGSFLKIVKLGDILYLPTKFMLAYQTDDKVSTHNQNYTYYPFAPFVSCKRVERQHYLDAVFVLFTGLLR